MEAIILCGGKGTRLQSVVSDRPKPMAEINGKPFLQYILDYWIGFGITHFVLSVGYLFEHVVNYFQDSYAGVPISYAIEETPRGTGGGLALALKELKTEQDCLIQNGDTFLKIDLSHFLSFHRMNRAFFTMAVKRAEKQSRYLAIMLGDNGQIVNLCASTNSVDCWVNAGCYIAQPKFIKQLLLREFNTDFYSLESDVFPKLIVQERVFGCPVTGYFIDIGLPNDYHTLRLDMGEIFVSES